LLCHSAILRSEGRKEGQIVVSKGKIHEVYETKKHPAAEDKRRMKWEEVAHNNEG